MRSILQIAFALIVVAGLCGCGGNNTYSPSFVGAANPDFTLSAKPASNNATQGNPTNYTITVAPTGGFSSPVTLGVSGLPSGAGGTFAPNPVSTAGSRADSVLTVTTTDGETTAAPGTYTLTIAGSGGNITRQTTVTLVITVAPPTQGSLNGTIQ